MLCWFRVQKLTGECGRLRRNLTSKCIGGNIYPLAQVIDGVARLVPTAHYFPLRLQCVQMLNRLAAATNTFVPVGSLLMDMLQFKDIHMKPTGGIGNALDFATTIKVCHL